MDETVREYLNRLYEALDDCSILAFLILENKRNKNTIEIKALLDRAMVLIEDEM